MLRDRQEQVLQQLADQHGLTAKKLAYLAGCSDREARRWMAGSTLISLEALNRILGHTDEQAITDALASFVFERSRYIAVDFEHVDHLDFNNDGQVDSCDAVLAVAQTGKSMLDALEQICKARSNGGHVDDDEAAELRPRVREVIRMLMQVDHIIAKEGLANRRRKAKPLGLTGG